MELYLTVTARALSAEIVVVEQGYGSTQTVFQLVLVVVVKHIEHKLDLKLRPCRHTLKGAWVRFGCDAVDRYLGLALGEGQVSVAVVGEHLARQSVFLQFFLCVSIGRHLGIAHDKA